MKMYKLMKLIVHVLLLVLALHEHTSISAVHFKHNSIRGVEIDIPVWRRELRSGGGGGGGRGGGGGGGGRGGGGGGSSGRGRGSGSTGNGGSSNSGGGGGRSVGSGGGFLKHRGLTGALISILFVNCLILIR
ncbi:hypothetical protein EUTSA_v10009088mg [Eutrema salsugineum]|uniref:Glycine-rich protein n=1 Tax=Eutrema salsugineum TaxID=72664 RepID=V4L845_EUTSA|nr:putative glycine-rich cell wall structural protein 1 [Eutrema salsugineum]ESQ35953.1 hypothetical protein EUTSA_v10009088mg [Eutrema salsugineum]